MTDTNSSVQTTANMHTIGVGATQHNYVNSMQTNTGQITTTAQQCNNAFVCGQNNEKLNGRIDDLEKRISAIEETDCEKKRLLKEASGVMCSFKYCIFGIPVVLFVSLIIDQCVFGKDVQWLNIVSIVLGLGAVVEFLFIPKLWHELDKRVEKLEELNKK